MERIVKENYYLDIAETVLERSTCLRRQYGAIIVRNDEIVASGTAQECIKALGMTRGSFYSAVSRATLGQRAKYTFFKEHIKKEDLPQ